jgi:FkbM family methyltransferase
MKKALLNLAAAVVKRTPRGGFPIMRMLARRFDHFQHMPIRLAPSGDMISADLRQRVWFPLWKHGCYPHCRGEEQLIRQIVQQGWQVWDVGANIGYMALLFRRLVGETGRVVAFEPSPQCAAYLARSAAAYDNILRIEAAVGATDGALGFVELVALDQSRAAGDNDADAIRVPMVKLDTVFVDRALAPPDFLKVDVEGYEKQVFLGAADLIGRYRPIVMFEALSVGQLDESLSVLNRIGQGAYRYSQITHDGSLRPIAEPRDMNAEATSNFLALTDRQRTRLTVSDSS